MVTLSVSHEVAEFESFLSDGDHTSNPYSLHRPCRDNSLGLEHDEFGWSIFLCERGSRWNEEWLSTEEQACSRFAAMMHEDRSTRR